MQPLNLKKHDFFLIKSEFLFVFVLSVYKEKMFTIEIEEVYIFSGLKTLLTSKMLCLMVYVLFYILEWSMYYSISWNGLCTILYLGMSLYSRIHIQILLHCNNWDFINNWFVVLTFISSAAENCFFTHHIICNNKTEIKSLIYHNSRV